MQLELASRQKTPAIQSHLSRFSTTSRSSEHLLAQAMLVITAGYLTKPANINEVQCHIEFYSHYRTICQVARISMMSIFIAVAVSAGIIITMSRKMKYAIVSTTVDSAGKAGKLAGLIVESRLAACVQTLPVQSVYSWKGKIEKSREHLLLSKTKASLAGKLIRFIRKHHSYEVPEIVITQITGGLKDYLSWIDKETRK